ncbi:MAG: DegV family protein [Coriobacteriia bacterium]|nr:DegV family protein [Coriobacteriia bacterium]
MPTTVPLLITDSCCDLSTDLLAGRGITVLDYPVILDGVEQVDAAGRPVSHALFYERVRAGAAPSTAAIPIPTYTEAFRAGASVGRPVILLGLSSALSGTFERALMARDIVLAEYPGADIRVIESLNASVALGLLVLEAADRIEAGASVDELAAWLDPARVTVNAYFTLETLEHLRRGGRISDMAAVAGTMLDIKPVLRIDETGALVISEKLRGRRKSMAMLADILARRVDGGRRILVGHGDSPEDAERLAGMVRERAGDADVIVTEVGPVIGSHVGPGMLAVAFLGAER